MEKNKRRKIEAECHVFKDQWTHDYFFIQFKNKAICLICKESISVFKEFNIRRHFETKHKFHYGILEGDLRDNKIQQLKKQLTCQQNVFKNISDRNQSGVKASF